MARLSREDEPGSWHHVVNRGLAKRPLFERRDDWRFFLARLVRQVRLGRIEIHAYCLLTTHFHLLVRSPRGELSEAMRRAQNEHSRRFNRRRRRDGALIRGRFFSRRVHSLEYRRTIVRYIDANPVKAGLVPRSGEFEAGSARAYLTETGPPWLSRGWIESESRRAAGIERFTPAAYRSTFGLGDAPAIAELSEFVEARLARARGRDSIEDLIGTAPDKVRAWMQRKAKLADGHRLGQPICGQRALRRALDAHTTEGGNWVVHAGPRIWRGEELAWVGLLREVCGLTWDEIGRASEGSSSHVRRAHAVHRRALEDNPTYAQRVVEVAHAAIARSLGTESHTVPPFSGSSVPHMIPPPETVQNR